MQWSFCFSFLFPFPFIFFYSIHFPFQFPASLLSLFPPFSFLHLPFPPAYFFSCFAFPFPLLLSSFSFPAHSFPSLLQLGSLKRGVSCPVGLVSPIYCNLINQFICQYLNVTHNIKANEAHLVLIAHFYLEIDSLVLGL